MGSRVASTVATVGVPGPARRHRSTVLAACVALVVAASACTWSAPRGDLAATGSNPSERTIVPAVVGDLVEVWHAPLGAHPTTPVVAGNTAVVATETTLAAYAASGCGQATCAPVWQDQHPSGWFGQPTIDGDQVYVPRDGELAVYDLVPGARCPAAATTCAPRWTAAEDASDVIAGAGVVITSGYEDLFVYETGTGTGCPGAVCTPTKVLPLPACGYVLGCFPSLASMAGSLVLVGVDERDELIEDGRVVAFDLDDCVAVPGGPDRCDPVWTNRTRGAVGAPVIADGAVFADGAAFTYDDFEGTYTYREHRVSRLGLDGTTGWTWSADALDRGVLAFADGTLVGTSYQRVQAFDADDGSIRWSAPVPTTSAGLSIGGGVVYVGTTTGVLAFDAAGTVGCSGTPITCGPLATLPATAPSTSASISNGLVWIAGADSTLHVLGLS